MSWFNKSDASAVAKSGRKQGYKLNELKSDLGEKVSVAIMMIDRDFKVTYVNQPTMDLLKKNAEAFRKLWPNFDPDKIIGACIDTFHKNPAHQRQMLSDPTRLPFKTEITIGDLKVQLNVAGSFDKQGNYVGNVLEWMDVTTSRMNEGMLDAINRAQAVIEFTLDGRIQHANSNFCNALGYSLDEIRGQHHSLFVEPTYRQSAEYRAFWEKLGRGEFDAGQYKRIGKGGKEIWIQATYNPILDKNGKAFKVVKFATDITAQVVAAQALQTTANEIAELVKGAVAGDFTYRIPIEGKEGLIFDLSKSMNTLSDTIGQIIGDLKRMLGALAEGDFTLRINKDYQGDFDQLKSDANAMADRINATLSELKAVAAEVTSASAEISASTTDLSQRTEEQAASLEETSASMEEMSATVKKNAENAHVANQSATATEDVADRGGQVVAKAVEAMARIEQSSSKISDIIGVIDEIARQTNLLALNAAVEAARAGDAGRGFAVVASEVRSLAQRSSQAAKDIKDLITSSNSQVKDGVDLVNRAGSALTEIVESIKKVTAIVSDIASASAEQSSGIDQINKALTQMDEVTQQNSALVEENAATAKTLENQASVMNDRVGFFRLVDGSPSSSAPAAVRREAPAARVPAAPSKNAHRPGRGPVGQMQSKLATALKADPEWKEF